MLCWPKGFATKHLEKKTVKDAEVGWETGQRRGNASKTRDSVYSESLLIQRFLTERLEVQKHWTVLGKRGRTGGTTQQNTGLCLCNQRNHVCRPPKWKTSCQFRHYWESSFHNSSANGRNTFEIAEWETTRDYKVLPRITKTTKFHSECEVLLVSKATSGDAQNSYYVPRLAVKRFEFPKSTFQTWQEK